MTNIEKLHRDSIDGLKDIVEEERKVPACVWTKGFDTRPQAPAAQMHANMVISLGI